MVILLLEVLSYTIKYFYWKSSLKDMKLGQGIVGIIFNAKKCLEAVRVYATAASVEWICSSYRDCTLKRYP